MVYPCLSLAGEQHYALLACNVGHGELTLLVAFRLLGWVADWILWSCLECILRCRTTKASQLLHFGEEQVDVRYQQQQQQQPTYVTRAWCIFESYAAALDFDLLFGRESRGSWVKLGVPTTFT